MHKKKTRWGYGEKMISYKPRRETSEKTDLLTPWSQTSKGTVILLSLKMFFTLEMTHDSLEIYTNTDVSKWWVFPNLLEYYLLKMPNGISKSLSPLNLILWSLVNFDKRMLQFTAFISFKNETFFRIELWFNYWWL